MEMKMLLWKHVLSNACEEPIETSTIAFLDLWGFAGFPA
jgi:hypothetical protein